MKWFNEEIGLFQLNDIKPETMFNKNYPFSPVAQLI